MKKAIRFFGMMVAIALASVNLTSCSSSDDDNEAEQSSIEQQLVGKWSLTKTEVVKELVYAPGKLLSDVQWFELKNDSQRSATWHDNAYDFGESNGIWLYSDDNELIMTVNSSQTENVVAPVIFNVESVKGNLLEVKHVVKDETTNELMYQVNFTYKKN